MNSTFPATFFSGKRGLRVIGDVHGDPAFRDAVDDARSKNLAILSIGDIVDRGTDNAGAIRTLIDIIDTGDGLMTPGNHCWSYSRHLMGREVKISNGRQDTLDQMAAAPDREYLETRFLEIAMNSMLWHRSGSFLFAHGGASSYMFRRDPVSLNSDWKRDRDLRVLVNRAMYGQTDGTTPEGHPKRVYTWGDRLAEGSTVVIGHDARSAITFSATQSGAQIVFIDTGAGKGGSLSWFDIDIEELECP